MVKPPCLRCAQADGWCVVLHGTQGVMNVPECWNPSFNMTPSTLCMAMQKVLGVGAYLPWVRDHIVQAQYFKARPLLPVFCWVFPGL